MPVLHQLCDRVIRPHGHTLPDWLLKVGWVDDRLDYWYVLVDGPFRKLLYCDQMRPLRALLYPLSYDLRRRDWPDLDADNRGFRTTGLLSDHRLTSRDRLFVPPF